MDVGFWFNLKEEDIMSHFTSITTEIRDLETCKEALRNMGLELQEEGRCRFFFGEEVKENVVELPGRYDMALEKQSNGSYSITADFYEGDVERTIGQRGSRLLREYGEKELKKMCKKMHLSISTNVKEPNGFKVKDPQDSSGGYMIVTFDEMGNISFSPKGIKGKKCSKFFKLEEALGDVSKREFLPEYYEERETAKTKTRERVRAEY